MVEALYKEAHGQRLSSREIFQKHGGDYFRRLEKQVLGQLERVDRCVLSTGGGTFIYNSPSVPLRNNSKIVYLRVDPDVLYRRIVSRGIPAFFQPDRPYESFHALLQERGPVYEKLADLKVDNSSVGIENVIKDILQWLATVSVNSLP